MLKFVLILFTSFLVPISAFAKKGQYLAPTEALYIVPSDSKVIQHSRFILKIIKPFKDETTTSIAYIFPPELVGEENKLIELYKTSERGLVFANDDIKAVCTTTAEIFSCNLYWLTKESLTKRLFFFDFMIDRAFAAQKSISLAKTISFIEALNLDNATKASMIDVANSFHKSEPLGFLSYEFQ